jgi:hypothetical protein
MILTKIQSLEEMTPAAGWRQGITFLYSAPVIALKKWTIASAA